MSQTSSSQTRTSNSGRTPLRLDYPQIAQAYEREVTSGSVEAKAKLGELYLHGRGVPKNYARASALINAAAESGNRTGLRYLGVMYEEGEAVPQNLASASHYYELAIQKNDPSACGRLGMLYLFGRGVERNLAKGKQLLQQGSALGDVWSKVELGRLYMTSKDASEHLLAIREYRSAADSGNRIAAYRLGRLLEIGQVVQGDPSEATRYYAASAAQGYPFAQFAMGRMLLKGVTLKADNVQAYKFFLLAKHAGVEQADTYIRDLARRMSEQEVAEATALAERFVLRTQTLMGDDDRPLEDNTSDIGANK